MSDIHFCDDPEHENNQQKLNTSPECMMNWTDEAYTKFTNRKWSEIQTHLKQVLGGCEVGGIEECIAATHLVRSLLDELETAKEQWMELQC